ncbi:hypothetical protein F4823DRAFT_596436 [Ustulina deusta]|nr:hypothetical protein F4823DRAFT_596436 [Ustulina deusta]
MRLLFVAIVLCADGQLLSCTTFLRISGQGTLLTRYLLEVAACLRKPSRKLPTIFFSLLLHTLAVGDAHYAWECVRMACGDWSG